MRNKFLLIAVALAVASGIAVAVLLSSLVPTVVVVKTKNNIEPGSILKGNLYTEKVSQAAVPPGSVRDISKVEKYHSSATLLKGDILRESHIAELKNGGTLAARLNLMNMKDRLGYALDPEITKGLNLEIGDMLQICAVSKYYQESASVSEKIVEVEAPLILIEAAPVISTPIGDTEEKEKQSIVVALSGEEFQLITQAGKIAALKAAVLPVGYKVVQTGTFDEKMENLMAFLQIKEVK